MDQPQTAVATDRRQELLERIVDHVLEHGIARVTLRGLAAAVGSNNRMLLYYFDSLEALIVTALQASEHRFTGMTSLFGGFADASVPIGRRIRVAWATIADPDNRPFHRLFFEIFGLAGFERERFAELLGVIGTEWVDNVAGAYRAAGIGAQDAEVLAHETVALWRGFQATLLSLEDDAVVARAADPAMDALVARVEAAATRS
ncbi:hypothetical protein AX769_08600 [Frondihabitans sp. PAMC 28766]|uniref:TetR/AcrR family transcriptional regulator n=1 Tax=Frondihabitans sp. PAMC 28766 TaxID=1795630 RepID=UPI00078BA1D4|nr:TetR/AcrR family transcriptional regulator [Frondihabitans sp. PAMC 28766]AMM20215.1 hypothetical protein AX769_08600 [Frondihabitans sp. PAMC 28766]